MQILAEAAQVWPLAGRWLEILEKFARDNKGVLAGVEGSMAEGVRIHLTNIIIYGFGGFPPLFFFFFSAYLHFKLTTISSAILFRKLCRLQLPHRQAPLETANRANRPSSQTRHNNNVMATHQINMSCRPHPPCRRQ